VRRCAVQRAKGQTSQILSFVGFHPSVSPPRFLLYSLPSCSSYPLPLHPICHRHRLPHPPSYLSLKLRLGCLPRHHLSSGYLPFIRPTMEFLHPLLATHLLVAHPPSHSLVADHPLDEHGQPSRFPTSSDRLGWPIGFPPERRIHSSARYDPLGSLVLEECALARKALCSSFAPRFFPGTIARGVLSDGTWTTEHPSVHVYLQSPSSRPSLTSRTSAAIYSLAALHVFYSPSHPSYDAFWHPDIKASTALFIHQVISTSTDIPLKQPRR